jgi:hypothetical protein
MKAAAAALDAAAMRLKSAGTPASTTRTSFSNAARTMVGVTPE